METLAAIFAAPGALLVLVGLIGGNFSFRTSAPEPTAGSPSNSVGVIAVPTGYTAKVFDAPYTTASVVTVLVNGAFVKIVCTIQGESVSSELTGNTSSLWDGTTDGGFVPDVFVNTGTNQPTMPNCAG